MCLILHAAVCLQSVQQTGSGRTASRGVNVRTAASVTDRQAGAAAALAGSEGAASEVSQ